MEQYCLTFKPIGVLTHIPDAQTIFGAVCNILIQAQGQEMFEKYIRSFEENPLFIHSSMFPKDYFPMIHQSLFSIDYINYQLLAQESQNQLVYLRRMKQLKKIKYVHKNIFDKYILKNQWESLKEDLLNEILVVDNGCLKNKEEKSTFQIQQYMNTHVQKNLYYFDKDMDNQLYYGVDIYCDKDTYFQIYIKTSLPKSEVWNIFQYAQYFGFGPKHSSGKNSFQLIDIEQINYSFTNQKVLLSKSLLDNAFDLEKSHYQITAKLHQTSQYYLNNTRTGRFHLFNEGSLMKVNENKDYYGKIIKLKNQDQPIYYYAIGYVL